MSQSPEPAQLEVEESLARVIEILTAIADSPDLSHAQRLAAATALEAYERGDYDTATRMIDYMVS